MQLLCRLLALAIIAACLTQPAAGAEYTEQVMSDGFMKIMVHVLDDPGYPDAINIISLLKFISKHTYNLFMEDVRVLLQETENMDVFEPLSVDATLEIVQQAVEASDLDLEKFSSFIEDNPDYDMVLNRLEETTPDEHDEL